MLRHMTIACLAFLVPAFAVSGPVTLTTLDGSVTVDGELVSFADGFFRVETAYGTLTLDGGNVTCEGVGCPSASDMVARGTFIGPDDMIHRLLPPLLAQYAAREGLEHRKIFTGDDALAWELSDPDTGALVARLDGTVSPETIALDQIVARKGDVALGRIEGAAGLRKDVVALDALVPVVAPDNPRAMLTLTQLGALIGGDAAIWPPLAAEELPVAVHLPKDDVSEDIVGRLLSGQPIGAVTRHDTMEDVSTAVAASPAALGLVHYSKIGNAVPLVIAGRCGLSVPATANTIKSEDYPMTIPLFLHRLDTLQPRIMRDFIAFARSEEAQAAIRSAGYVDQSIGRIGFDRQGDRLANAVLAAADDLDAMAEVQRMIASLMDGDRLTLTFRFKDGSSDLDAQSASNVVRLADVIAEGAFDGRELIFVGFTDGIGERDANRRLSERRARAVLRAVRSYSGDAPVQYSIDAFGESMPMACDDTEWGRQVNRRVEVWIR